MRTTTQFDRKNVMQIKCRYDFMLKCQWYEKRTSKYGMRRIKLDFCMYFIVGNTFKSLIKQKNSLELISKKNAEILRLDLFIHCLH